MRILNLGPIAVGTTHSFDRAFDLAFSTEALEEAHGGPVSATPWASTCDRLERTVLIKSPFPIGVPDVLKRFVAGDSFRMTVRQLGKVDSNKERVLATVENKTQFHIIGSKLLRTQSSIEIAWERATGQTDMRAQAKIVAWLPPPIKSIAESFVLKIASENAVAYFRAVANIMSRDQVR